MNHTTDQAALQRALDAALAERNQEMASLLAYLKSDEADSHTLSRRAEAWLVVLLVVGLCALVVWGALR